MDLHKKEIAYSALLVLIEKKIETIENEIALSEETMGDFCKSSAGDKYETDRAMAHLEISKNQQQLDLNIRLKTQLLTIELSKNQKAIDVGSYVITSKGDFFISIALGTVKADFGSFYAISLGSPFGTKLKGKKVGDSITINGNCFIIEDIL